ncbi:hypothetical protein L1987_85087 [Smallanthus sonchifolius]|uniref:Uncharacterized protein n=1 Tax=Smallanthus sonchifolius TaxID=185202 RepID=A0ACB8XV13_9ASTR|nr:hypothetical protein L1987_85087 [Smallanthus sonchifolius]
MVLNDDNDDFEDYIWQSFDHLGNTFLPSVRFGRNLERDLVRNVTSWKSADDPTPGPYMVYMDFNGYPQIFQKNGDVIQFRLGIWNGLGFTGMPSLKPNPIFSLRTQGWFLYLTPTVDNCVRYGLCGVYGSCDIEQSPSCECMKGFTAKRCDQWDVSAWTGGCQREIPLDCVAGDGFRKYSSLKLPDTRQSWYDRNITLEQCDMKCRNECNCTTYTTLDIKENIGCLICGISHFTSTMCVDHQEDEEAKAYGPSGYMSPEYAGDGIISVKSDIFSFGVLVLEIVSGKKNRGFFHEDHNHNLLGHAWRLHREGKTLEVVDASMIGSDQTFELLLCIHVGLLCVQA